MVRSWCNTFYCPTNKLRGDVALIVHHWYNFCEDVESEVHKFTSQRSALARRAFDLMDARGGSLLAQHRGTLEYTRLTHVPEIARLYDLDLSNALRVWNRLKPGQRSDEQALAANFPHWPTHTLFAVFKTLALHAEDVAKQVAVPDMPAMDA